MTTDPLVIGHLDLGRDSFVLCPPETGFLTKHLGLNTRHLV